MSSSEHLIRPRSERTVLLRSCPYTRWEWLHSDSACRHRGRAFCLNISDGGMMILMNDTPQRGDVLDLEVPAVTGQDSRRMGAEVRWARRLLDEDGECCSLVGVMFTEGLARYSPGEGAGARADFWSS